VLWNLGVFRWKGKDDPKGAVKLWNQLLASNPKLPQDRKQQVQKAIAAAKETPKYAAAIR
jgi:cytochrome c-type biogenesis protein CcmH/NrfG